VNQDSPAPHSNSNDLYTGAKAPKAYCHQYLSKGETMFKIIGSINRAFDKTADVIDPVGDTCVEAANITCDAVKRAGVQQRLDHVAEDREIMARFKELSPEEQAYVRDRKPRAFAAVQPAIEVPAKLSAKPKK